MLFCNDERDGKINQNGLRRKQGASLPMVVIIGVALVIWVLALLPLMVTSGEQGIETAQMEQEYLDSRSAIEFTKSELVKIVQTGLPYSFVVIDNGYSDANARYVAIKRTDSAGTVSGDYKNYVNSASDELDDVPQTTEALIANGNKVAAICSVKLNNSGNYDITVRTYVKGTEGLTFYAQYTVTGELMIYPEAYNQVQALPLSDFVVVDGKLGARTIWDSTMNKRVEVIRSVGGYTWRDYVNIKHTTYYDKDNDKYTEGYSESFLPWKLPIAQYGEGVGVAGEDYADTGRFPAVFKTIAHTTQTPTQTDFRDPGSLHTIKKGIRPYASNFNYDSSNDKVTLFGTELGAGVLSYNGASTKPDKAGLYDVNISYNGGTYNGNEVLDAKGLYKTTIPVKLDGSGNIVSKKQTIKTDSTLKVTVNNNKATINYTPDSAEYTGQLYIGYTTSKTGEGITWTTTNGKTLEASSNYYFYCYLDGFMGSDGTIYEPSDIYYVGRVVYYGGPKIEIRETNLSTNQSYMLVSGTNGSTVNVLYGDSGDKLNNISLNNYSTQDYFGTNANDYLWKISGNDSSGWKFQNVGNNLYINNKSEITNTWGWPGTHYEYGFSSVLSEDGTSFSRNGNSFYKIHRLMTRKAATSLVSDTYTDFTIYLRSTGKYANDDSESIKVMVMPDTEDGNTNISHTWNPKDDLANVKVDLNCVYDTTPMTYADVTTQVQSALRAVTDNAGNAKYPQIIVDELYLNSVACNKEGTDKIAPGSYKITVKVKKSETATDKLSYYFDAGKLTVKRAGMSGAFSVEVEANIAEFDISSLPLKDKMTGEGTIYYGYQVLDSSGNPEGEVYWYTTPTVNIPLSSDDDAAADLRFFVEHSVFTGSAAPVDKNVPHVIPITEADRKNFIYTVGSIVDWHRSVTGLDDSMIHLHYYVENAGSGEGWIPWDSYSYVTHGRIIKYGAQMDNTLYDGRSEDPQYYMYELYGPLPITGSVTDASGKTYYPSYLAGESMYFMGDTAIGGVPYSINTHGTSLSLETDLLVLNHWIYDGGDVYVYTYSESNREDGVLLFAVNELGGIFKAKNFYLIPNGINLAEVTEEMAKSWLCVDASEEHKEGTSFKYINDDPAQGIKTIEFCEKVKNLCASKYPNPNLDVAYATKEQLAHVISGETVGWTVAGEMVDNDDSDNSNIKYVVCAYIEDNKPITKGGGLSHNANRIMLASEEKITVNSDLTLWTRYLSLDIEDLYQGVPNVKCEVKNIVKSSGLNWYGSDEDYNSNTVQVDYENYTNIHNYVAAGGTPVGRSVYAQICRYASPTNLFQASDEASIKQELLVPYLTKDVNSKFAGNVLSDIIMVDRYITLKARGEDEDTTEIVPNMLAEIGYNKELRIFTNYLHFDREVTAVKTKATRVITGTLDNKILINSQESGYNEDEYLLFFKSHSAESYSGTLMYVEGEKLTVTYTVPEYKQTGTNSWGWPEYGWVDIPQNYEIGNGFYLIPATNGGTDLVEIARDIAEGTNNTGVQKIDITELFDYTVTVNPDGTISDAYVNTGVPAGQGATAGFGGGGVK